MKYLIGAAALAMSTTALAQTTTTTSATPPAPATAPATTTESTTTTTTTAPADAAAPAAAPAAPAAATTSTTESTTTTTAQAAPAPAPTPAADPKAVLAQQFPTYDKDSDGKLSQTEFAAWLVEMKTAQNTEKLSPEAIRKWANDSFAKADKDKSKGVTVAELQGFLVPNA